MSEDLVCDSCGKALKPHTQYILRIDVFADPALPSTTAKAIAETDFESEMAALMEQMKLLSADELQDQVHRRFEFKVCPTCQMKFLANPLGKPRVSGIATN